MAEEDVLKTLEDCAEYLRAPHPDRALVGAEASTVPLPLYYHEAELQFRVGDLHLLARRLFAGRHRLRQLRAQMYKRFPNAHRMPNEPPLLQRLKSREFAVSTELRLDFESLFHFGAVALDQWSFVVAHLAGLANRHTPFAAMVDEELDRRGTLPPALAILHRDHRAAARWLCFWFRHYRNTFVVHTRAPVQRGHITGGMHADITLFIPAAVGSTGPDDVKAVLRLTRLGPAWLRALPATHRDRAVPGVLLSHLIENVGYVEPRADRDALAHAVDRVGTETPRSLVVLSVLARFLRDATRAVVEAAETDPTRIVLGL